MIQREMYENAIIQLTLMIYILIIQRICWLLLGIFCISSEVAL